MLQKLHTYIKTNRLFSEQDKLIVGISGGEDSVVLAHLLKKMGYQFSLAHMNFNLRGKDSRADENFCKALAKKLHVEIQVKQVNIEAYCQLNKVSIQVAARNLRYDWFDDLLKKSQSRFILTAHHANDSIETLFINLLRGTGIKGLRGIPEKTEKLVRPLLPFEKTEIARYAQQNKILSRLDKSNLEDKYQRNFIRQHIIPKLKKLNPQLEQTFLQNIKQFKEESAIVSEYLELKSKEIITALENGISINKTKLKQEKYQSSLVHFLIADFGFNESQEKGILQNILSEGLSGKSFYSNSHHLVIERNQIVVRPLEKHYFNRIKIASYKELKQSEIFKLSLTKKFKQPAMNEIYLHPAKLIYPLTVRTKKTGDKFKPFGMKGFKLLSDFMKDQKFSLFEKEKCRVLVNGNDEIIWVMNYRSDERYRVDTNKTSFIKLTSLD